MLPARVTIVEVGPRDGLQNEAAPLQADAKIRFVDLLSDAGLPVIEVSAFVSAQRVPQMADAETVVNGIARRAGTRYSALVPNVAGLDRAHAAGLREVAVFAAASDSFSRRNLNRSVEESLTSYGALCARALDLDLRVRGYVSTAFGCPFEGTVPPDRVVRVAAALRDMGVFEVAISDTIGIAHPGQVTAVLERVMAQVPPSAIALHFHDTRGMALANVLTALHLGVTTFDASAGGLGGCPFAPGATGNLATEDLVYMLDGLGVASGVDMPALLAASRFIESRIGHPLPSRVFRATQSLRALNDSASTLL